MQKSHDIPEDDFIHQINLSILTDDIIYIKNAIQKYKGVLSEYYINWASEILIELIEKALNKMSIKRK